MKRILFSVFLFPFLMGILSAQPFFKEGKQLAIKSTYPFYKELLSSKILCLNVETKAEYKPFIEHIKTTSAPSDIHIAGASISLIENTTDSYGSIQSKPFTILNGSFSNIESCDGMGGYYTFKGSDGKLVPGTMRIDTKLSKIVFSGPLVVTIPLVSLGNGVFSGSLVYNSTTLYTITVVLNNQRFSLGG